jgi:hypothetical protein
VETLRAPVSWWMAGGVLVGAVWLVLIVVSPQWAALLGAALTAAAVASALWLLGSARVGVLDGEVVAGRAHVPLQHCGTLTALDAEQARRWRGPDADANAFLVLRPYVMTAVRIEITDPADPTPYWLVSARHPQRLVDAARATRDDEAR